jgi:hypothetical protein
MTTDIIDKILDNTESIGELTFTGGEPLLNSEIIKYAIDKIINNGINLSGFFMVTNGTIFDNELYFKLIELYWYCMGNYNEFYGGVAVSIDEFHENDEDSAIVKKWKSLKFYSNSKEHHGKFEGLLIDEGNANECGIGNRSLILNKVKYKVESDLCFEDMVYINANGDVLNDCDMSYQTQDENILGNIFEDNYFDIID